MTQHIKNLICEQTELQIPSPRDPISPRMNFREEFVKRLQPKCIIVLERAERIPLGSACEEK